MRRLNRRFMAVAGALALLQSALFVGLAMGGGSGGSGGSGHMHEEDESEQSQPQAQPTQATPADGLGAGQMHADETTDMQPVMQSAQGAPASRAAGSAGSGNLGGTDDTTVMGDAHAGFCSGMATAMYMQGFVSVFSSDRASQPCAVFLHPACVLNTPGKFVAGCLAAGVLGVMTEGANAFRRVVLQTGPVFFLINFLTLGLGYIVMLLVMIYNIEIAISVILGLCIGRTFLSHVGRDIIMRGGVADPMLHGENWGNPKMMRPMQGGATPCCIE